MRGLPPEVERERDDSHLRSSLPPGWSALGLVWITYASEVPCSKCRYWGLEATWLTLGERLVFGPFCGDDCLLDVVHTRPMTE